MANTFSIRRAGPADSEVITRVHAASWRTTYQGLVEDAFLDEFFDRGLDDRIAARRSQRHDDLTWVAVTPANHVVGYLQTGPTRDLGFPEYPVELYAIYLVKGWQRLGVGRALVRPLAEAVHDSPNRGVLVWALEQNPARDFYESLGDQYLTAEPIRIGRLDFKKCAYGWTDLPGCLGLS